MWENLVDWNDTDLEKTSNVNSFKSKLADFNLLAIKEKFKNVTKEEAIEYWNANKSMLLMIIALVLGGIAAIVGIVFATKTWNAYAKLSDTVTSLEQYQNDDPEIKKIAKIFLKDVDLRSRFEESWKSENWVKLYDLIDLESVVEKQNKEKEEIYSQSREPFIYFLQYIYLPNQNIWKNPFTMEIDIDLYWEEYILKNVFLDANLLAKWTNYFQHSFVDSLNMIESLEVWEIKSQSNDMLFGVPIDITFKAPDKRSFLAMLSKLTITANTRNIININEFTSDLWYSLKYYYTEKYSNDWIINYDSIQEDYGFTWSVIEKWKIQWNAIERILWMDLYNWSQCDYWNSKKGCHTLVKWLDDQLIFSVLKEYVWCSTEKFDFECANGFRKKMKNIQFVAYNLGIDEKSLEWDEEKILIWLHEVYKNLTTVMTIWEFEFSKEEDSELWWDAYNVSLNMTVYWRIVTDLDVLDIINEISKKCIDKGIWFNIKWALDRIDTKLKEVDPSTVWAEVIYDLQKMKEIFTEDEKMFEGLSNFKKIVKLIESYRMIRESWYCTKKGWM